MDSLRRASVRPLLRRANRRGFAITICRPCLRSIATGGKVFQEGDIVILKPTKDTAFSPGLLTRPLHPDKIISTHNGIWKHADIIGKRPRDPIASHKGIQYRIFEPSLPEYIRLTPRLVTPIYPDDANLIVSLLDIHVEPPTPENAPPATPPIEILEAGTGHGALTLYLARAIQAANPTPPPEARLHSPRHWVNPPIRSQTEQVEAQDDDTPSESIADETPITPPPTVSSPLAEEDEEIPYLGDGGGIADDPQPPASPPPPPPYPSTRRAILHTLDANPKHSLHARKLIKQFRRGLYLPHIDFHVGDVASWLAKHLALRNDQPFLSHILLDLPAADRALSLAAQALRPDGILAVFNPSVTQIGELVREIKLRRLPFAMEQVVEIGATVGTGGRLWDVRTVMPKSVRRRVREEKGTMVGGESAAEETKVDAVDGEQPVLPDVKETLERVKEMEGSEENEEWKMVCRPKVGEMVVGGGFVGVWRRLNMERTLWKS